MPWLGVSWSLALILAYLVGSLPTAYLAARMMKGKDIREEGDRNAGAGNVYRMIGPKVGLLVGALDIAKGGIAVLVAKGLTGSVWAEMGTGVVVVAGHNWSIFQGLRGGRGAASTIGVFMALIPIPAIPLSLAGLAILPIARSATVAIALIMVPMALLAWLTGASYYVVAYSIGLPAAVGIRHHLTSKKLHRLEEQQPEGQALPEG